MFSSSNLLPQSHVNLCSNIFRVHPTSFSLLPLPNMNVNKAYFLLFWVQKVCCVYIYLFLVAHNEVYSENWFRVHFYVNHKVKSSYRCLQSEYFAFHTFTTRATETWLKNRMMRGSSIWTTKLLLRRSTVEDNSTSNKQCAFIKYGIRHSPPCLGFKKWTKKIFYIFAQMGQCGTSYT